MTCAPELPAPAPATLTEANGQLAILHDQLARARNILNQGGELPDLGYTEGDVTVDEHGMVTVPLSGALTVGRLVTIPDAAERLALRLLEAVARHRAATR